MALRIKCIFEDLTQILELIKFKSDIIIVVIKMLCQYFMQKTQDEQETHAQSSHSGDVCLPCLVSHLFWNWSYIQYIILHRQPCLWTALLKTRECWHSGPSAPHMHFNAKIVLPNKCSFYIKRWYSHTIFQVLQIRPYNSWAGVLNLWCCINLCALLNLLTSVPKSFRLIILTQVLCLVESRKYNQNLYISQTGFVSQERQTC